ncbi:MAG: mevalonate kinase [Myxococcales bacterium]|nr:mevalonate kinase [Myxococcales bacterium]
MARGYGKVILFGEHAVVHGRPALAASLGRGVQAQAVPSKTGDRLSIDPWNHHVAPDPDSHDALARAFAALLTHVRHDRAPLHVHAQVQLPAGAGLGCSAALSVAVGGAIDELLEQSMGEEEEIGRSLAWERIFHGTPSGIDSTMALGRGLGVFRTGHAFERIACRVPLPLVVAHTGIASPTKDMVGAVNRFSEQDPEAAKGIFDGMAAIVDNGRLAARAGDLSALGGLMELNQKLLNALLVSTDELENLCARAREAGALGAKLTGAGGGGCIVALAPDLKRAGTIADALRGHATEVFTTEVGVPPGKVRP